MAIDAIDELINVFSAQSWPLEDESLYQRGIAALRAVDAVSDSRFSAVSSSEMLQTAARAAEGELESYGRAVREAWTKLAIRDVDANVTVSAAIVRSFFDSSHDDVRLMEAAVATAADYLAVDECPLLEAMVAKGPLLEERVPLMDIRDDVESRGLAGLDECVDRCLADVDASAKDARKNSARVGALFGASAGVPQDPRGIVGRTIEQMDKYQMSAEGRRQAIEYSLNTDPTAAMKPGIILYDVDQTAADIRDAQETAELGRLFSLYEWLHDDDVYDSNDSNDDDDYSDLEAFLAGVDVTLDDMDLLDGKTRDFSRLDRCFNLRVS